MDLQTVGKLVAALGVGLIVLGGLFWLGGRLGLGSLPGDVKITGEGWSCFVPITTSIILSLLLTAILTLAAWLFRGK